MSAETLGRVLKSCQSVLEGGADVVSDRAHVQCAVQNTVRVLDSVLYLTGKNTNTKTHKLMSSAPTCERIDMLMCVTHCPYVFVSV